MNFEFSEEQLFIRDQARNFLSQESTVEVVRNVLDGQQSYHQELWQQIVDLGWTAMAIPEEFGGLGLGAQPSRQTSAMVQLLTVVALCGLLCL